MLDIPTNYWNKLKKRAASRNIQFLISYQDAAKMLLIQNNKCALSGLPIGFGTEFSPSLDRIDSQKPYVRHNIQWVYSPINIMKGPLNDDYFKYLCSLIASVAE